MALSALLDGAFKGLLPVRLSVVRYVVLLRFGFHDLRTVLTVERLEDGAVWCREQLPPHAGVTWWPDGRVKSESHQGAEWSSYRSPLTGAGGLQAIHSISGSRLLDPALPAYDLDLDRGATIQLSGDDVLAEPHQVALQIVAVPRGEQPRHRETVGDRRIDEGQPDLWVVLHSLAGEPPDRVAAVLKPRHSPPPVWISAKRPFGS